MFEYILLDSIIKLNGERTIYNIFHLLSAKKSTQTIQDSNLFGLTNYFGVYKSLHRQEFTIEIHRLRENQLVSFHHDQQIVVVTDKGKAYYNELHEKYGTYFYLNGADYHHTAEHFQKHLLLFIQTLTHLHIKEHRFIPIIEDVESQKFVKRLWKNIQQHGTEKLLKYVYQDLHFILRNFPDTHAGVFVDSLTTYKKVGLSRYQLANKYHKSYHDMYLIFTNMIHAICKTIELKQPLTILSQLYPVHKKNPLLSDSANQTYYYIQQGLTIEEIANLRHLKENTIKDHIVEIAYLDKTLDWSPYMTRQQYVLIKEIFTKLKSKKLKDIKKQLPDAISYFQIKLVMALGQRESTGEHYYV
ncbi:helix-turn-helix domain-containing protein [Gracilibacillus sp. HCP3S3_G5_1]|uniref:helix-turn-helix domain-containing protein n=1 Tax=unclassified Gracilibacillus TaxID=2625209 RepID=UPI003F896559